MSVSWVASNFSLWLFLNFYLFIVFSKFSIVCKYSSVNLMIFPFSHFTFQINENVLNKYNKGGRQSLKTFNCKGGRITEINYTPLQVTSRNQTDRLPYHELAWLPVSPQPVAVDTETPKRQSWVPAEISVLAWAAPHLAPGPWSWQVAMSASSALIRSPPCPGW